MILAELHDRFQFPTARDEAWRYTNVQPLLKARFDDQPSELRGVPDEAADFVFVNGRLVRSTPVAGVTIERTAMGKVAQVEGHAFVALNGAFSTDGAFITVTGKLAAPLRILWLSSAQSMAHPRLMLTLAPGAEATVVERFLSLDQGERFTNAVGEIVLGEQASLRYVKWQDEARATFHLHTLSVRQERGARFDCSSLAFGSRLARTEISTELHHGAEADLRGLFLSGQEQAQDHVIFVRHQAPHGRSRQLFKGVLDGDGKSVFDGRVRVDPDAQKTDAAQKNQNLLLSKNAVAVSKPHLEIYADDVKCAHGATSGELSADALFYLRARGIDELDAKAILARAFAGEVIDALPVLRDEATARVEQWFK